MRLTIILLALWALCLEEREAMPTSLGGGDWWPAPWEPGSSADVYHSTL